MTSNNEFMSRDINIYEQQNNQVVITSVSQGLLENGNMHLLR